MPSLPFNHVCTVTGFDPKDIVSCTTTSSLTTMIGDLTLKVANLLGKYGNGSVLVGTPVTVNIDGVNMWYGTFTANDPLYQHNEMSITMRGKDLGNKLIDTQIRQAWLLTNYSDIMTAIVQKTGLNYSIVESDPATNTPHYYPVKDVDAFNALRDVCSVTLGNANPYDFFVDLTGTLQVFPRGAKPNSQNHKIGWGTGAPSPLPSENIIEFHGPSFDVTKMRNDVGMWGGSPQYPDYKVANQGPATPPAYFHDSDPTNISKYGSKQYYEDSPSEKSMAFMSQKASNYLQLNNALEERTWCRIVGDPTIFPGDTVTVNSPWGDNDAEGHGINGDYYVYEVQQEYDHTQHTYTTMLTLSEDMLRFNQAAHRAQVQLQRLENKLNRDPRPNFSWIVTSAPFPTSGPYDLKNPKYSLQQYDYISNADFIFCDIASAASQACAVPDSSATTDQPLDPTWAYAQRFQLDSSIDSFTVSPMLKRIGTNISPFYYAIYAASGDVPGSMLAGPTEILPTDVGTSYAFMNLDVPDTSDFGTDLFLALWANPLDGAIYDSSDRIYWHAAVTTPNPNVIPTLDGANSTISSGSVPGNWSPLWSVPGTGGTARVATQFVVCYTARAVHSADYYGLEVYSCNPIDTTPHPIQSDGTLTLPCDCMADGNGQIDFKVVAKITQPTSFSYTCALTTYGF